MNMYDQNNMRKSLRQIMLTARGELALEQVQEMSGSIIQKLGDFKQITEAETVMCFLSIKNEVNLYPFIDQAQEQGKRVLVPRVESAGAIRAVEFQLESVRKGPYGIIEPEGEPVDEKLIDAVLVPGLVFDFQGYRLGYGAGYYDRFLPLLRPDTFCKTTIAEKEWWNGTLLLTFFGDGKVVDNRVIEPKDVYWYLLDISDASNYIEIGADERIEKEEKNKLLDKLITQQTDNKQCTINILNNWNCNVEPLQNIDFFDILDKHFIKSNKINTQLLPQKQCKNENCDGKCDKMYICPSLHKIPKKLASLWKNKDPDLLYNFIIDAITNYYKENNVLPPIINTDTSRNNYLLKIKDGDNDIWINDKKGVKFIDIIIKPFMDYLIVLLNKFNNQLLKNIKTNSNVLITKAITYFENELKELEKNKPRKKQDYNDQKRIYLEYIDTFKNYNNNILMQDISYVLDICYEKCSNIYEQYSDKREQINAEKVLVYGVIDCLSKTSFMSNILTKLSPHFYKTHDDILTITSN